MTHTTTAVSAENNMFIKADEVSKTMGISRAYAYRIIKQLNGELKDKGYIVIEGRTSRKYFNERLYRKVY